MCLIDNTKLDAIISTAGVLPNAQAIEALLGHICKENDFAFLHFSTTAPDETVTPYVASTYPENWLADYYQNSLYRQDPMTKLVMYGVEPFNWAEVQADTETGRYIMLERTRVLGSEAITIPTYSSDGSSSKLSVAAKAGDKDWHRRVARKFESLKQLGMTMHAAVLHHNGSTLPQVELSQRHIDCLKMLAAGLNEKQIGSFLSICEKSVKTYIKEASIRLNARTKVQAVAHAMGIGIIKAH